MSEILQTLNNRIARQRELTGQLPRLLPISRAELNLLEEVDRDVQKYIGSPLLIREGPRLVLWSPYGKVPLVIDGDPLTATNPLQAQSRLAAALEIECLIEQGLSGEEIAALPAHRRPHHQEVGKGVVCGELLFVAWDGAWGMWCHLDYDLGLGLRITGPLSITPDILSKFVHILRLAIAERKEREVEYQTRVTTNNAEQEADDRLKQIVQRLQGVAHIPITDDTTGQKHYGFKIGVGDNTLGDLWHCTDDRKHPADTPEFYASGGDRFDLYCDSHYATVDDEAALAFLIHAREDIQFLLARLGHQVELKDSE